MGPAWVQWIFSVACLAVGGYYAATLITRSGEPRSAGVDYDLSHFGMALGMAAMFSPFGDPAPPMLWIIVFGTSAAWFASRTLRTGLQANATTHHLVANLAMLFMLLTGHQHQAAGSTDLMAGHEGHTGTAGGGLLGGPIGTVLTVLLICYFVLHTGRWLRVLGTPPAPSAPPGEPVGTGPVAVVAARREREQSRAAVGCHVVMGTAMAVMFGLILLP